MRTVEDVELPKEWDTKDIGDWRPAERVPIEFSCDGHVFMVAGGRIKWYDHRYPDLKVEGGYHTYLVFDSIVIPGIDDPTVPSREEIDKACENLEDAWMAKPDTPETKRDRWGYSKRICEALDKKRDVLGRSVVPIEYVLYCINNSRKTVYVGDMELLRCGSRKEELKRGEISMTLRDLKHVCK